jgi:ADP-L-glycero-D-manno-heptose 6-epimerase
MGELGYDDRHEIIPNLKPLNPYGESKNEFDKWVLMQKSVPPFWAGFKFFNVYGPNEYHKNRMASVIFHTYNQILKNGKMLLFKSHHPDFENGKQMRDFVYVKDLVNILIWFMQNKPTSGIYNLGTGKARTFLDLVNAVFDAVNIEPKIEFIDTPLDIRDKYQYFTQANMVKTIGTGYKKQFFSLEEGVNDYVKNYLIDQRFF